MPAVESGRQLPESWGRSVMLRSVFCHFLDDHNSKVGQITMVIRLIELKKNIAVGMIKRNSWAIDQRITVQTADGTHHSGSITTWQFRQWRQEIISVKRKNIMFCIEGRSFYVRWELRIFPQKDDRLGFSIIF